MTSAVAAWMARAHGAAFESGRTPASHLEAASWFTLTGVLLTVIVFAVAAALWTAVDRPAMRTGRARGLRIVWGSLSLIWLAVLSAFS